MIGLCGCSCSFIDVHLECTLVLSLFHVCSSYSSYANLTITDRHYTCSMKNTARCRSEDPTDCLHVLRKLSKKRQLWQEEAEVVAEDVRAEQPPWAEAGAVDAQQACSSPRTTHQVGNRKWRWKSQQWSLSRTSRMTSNHRHRLTWQK